MGAELSNRHRSNWKAKLDPGVQLPRVRKERALRPPPGPGEGTSSLGGGGPEHLPCPLAISPAKKFLRPMSPKLN